MVSDDLQILVRKAARAVGRHGLAHAYGHVSVRLDQSSFLVCAAQPMAHIAPGTPGTVVKLDAELPTGVLGEVRIHREIYRARPLVGGIVRSMPPKTMALSVLGRTAVPRHGLGSYFHPAIPLWDDPALIRNDAGAVRLAQVLGTSAAIAMRGNGLMTVGSGLEEAVVLAWYAEDAARIELEILATGLTGTSLTQEEAVARATWSGAILERMWSWLTAGDPE